MGAVAAPGRDPLAQPPLCMSLAECEALLAQLGGDAAGLELVSAYVLSALWALAGHGPTSALLARAGVVPALVGAIRSPAVAGDPALLGWALAALWRLSYCALNAAALCATPGALALLLDLLLAPLAAGAAPADGGGGGGGGGDGEVPAHLVLQLLAVVVDLHPPAAAALCALDAPMALMRLAAPHGARAGGGGGGGAHPEVQRAACNLLRAMLAHRPAARAVTAAYGANLAERMALDLVAQGGVQMQTYGAYWLALLARRSRSQVIIAHAAGRPARAQP